MATCDQTSDLLHRIPYPASKPPIVRRESAARTWRSEQERPPAVQSMEGNLEDSLFREIEAGATLTRNPRASVGSMIVLALVLLAVIIVPLYRVETLPKQEVFTRLYLQPPAAAGSTAGRVQPRMSAFTPTSTSVPTPMRNKQESAPVPPPPVQVASAGVVGGVPGGVGNVAPAGAMNEILSHTDAVPLPTRTPEPQPVKRIHVAGRVAEANLIRDVQPEYPAEAGRARIEGTVVLTAVIGKDGSVLDVRVENGIPILAQAAVQAVRQWRYKPYLLNGEPVEIESRITVNFALS